MEGQNSTLALYEQEFISTLQQMNLDMCEFAESDLMTDHAYNELSMLQKTQMDQIRTMFRHMKTIIGSKYYKKRCGGETTIQKKRMSEMAKRQDAVLYPDKYAICPCCDSIFTNKFNLARHRTKTLKCSLIKCSKKGALECETHRAPHSISAYINNHLDDPDSDDDVEEQIQNEMVDEEQIQNTIITVPHDTGAGMSVITTHLADMGIATHFTDAELDINLVLADSS